jgi:hypothetical protein
VLRPNGSLRFVEHGRSPDASVAWWQDRLTPLWRRCSGGCHLNRKTDDLLRSAGFRLTHLATGYAPGPRPMTFMYEGGQNPDPPIGRPVDGDPRRRGTGEDHG